MLISFIVPVYNTELYLEECLNSLLNQNISHDEYEIICINDGSKDSSLDILNKYALTHSNIYVIDQQNSGVSVARNVGLEHANGDYSGILLRSSDMSHRKLLIQNHNRQLSRPITEVTLYNGGPLYDPRLSMLLHLVEDTHSVRDACSLMQMSYSAAWNLLNRVEDELGFPLITRNRGGASGRGSDLTAKGRQLVETYDRFSADLNREARALYGQFFDSFVDAT